MPLPNRPGAWEPPSLAALDRERVRRGGLAAFIRLAWPHVEQTPLVWSWHIECLAAHCEALALGAMASDIDGGTCVANVPPGTGKSTVCSVLFPAWVWTWDPGSRWIAASYDAKLVIRDATRAYELVASRWYRERWPDGATFGRRVSAMGDYTNDQGGFRYSTSIPDGRVTGRHAHYHLIDDPLKPALAAAPSAIMLDRTEAYLRETLPSRAVKLSDLKTLLVMQRLHERDPSAFYLDRQTAVHVRLPMHYDPEVACQTPFYTDPRQTEGELLDPQRFNEHVLAERKTLMSDVAFSAQYEQNPYNRKGAIVDVSDVHRLPEVPDVAVPGTWAVWSWDLAFKGKGREATPESRSRVAGQLWIWRRTLGYVCCAVRVGFLDFVESCDAIRAAHKAFPTAHVIIEDKANGPAAERQLRQAVPRIELVPVDADKVARLWGVSPLVKRGEVSVPTEAALPGADELLTEIHKFPRGRFNDQVDAATQALHWLSDKVAGASAYDGLAAGMR